MSESARGASSWLRIFQWNSLPPRKCLRNAESLGNRNARLALQVAGLISFPRRLGHLLRVALCAPRVSAASGSCCRAGASRSGREHIGDGSHGPEWKAATLAGVPSGIARQGGIEHRTKARATIAERISNLFVDQGACWDSEKSHCAPDAAYESDAPGVSQTAGSRDGGMSTVSIYCIPQMRTIAA